MLVRTTPSTKASSCAGGIAAAWPASAARAGAAGAVGVSVHAMSAAAATATTDAINAANLTKSRIEFPFEPLIRAPNSRRKRRLGPYLLALDSAEAARRPAAPGRYRAAAPGRSARRSDLRFRRRVGVSARSWRATHSRRGPGQGREVMRRASSAARRRRRRCSGPPGRSRTRSGRAAPPSGPSGWARPARDEDAGKAGRDDHDRRPVAADVVDQLADAGGDPDPVAQHHAVGAPWEVK